MVKYQKQAQTKYVYRYVVNTLLFTQQNRCTENLEQICAKAALSPGAISSGQLLGQENQIEGDT